MSNFDGDDFKAVDEDAYAEDRPMSTFLDHATRNNLYACGRFGPQCSYSERLDTDGTAAPIYSGNPSTLRGVWVLRASPGCEGYEYDFTAAAGPSSASSTEGEVWLEVIHPTEGLISGDKQALTNTADESTYETYLIDVDFGEALKNETTLAVAVMFQSAAYSTADSSVTLGPSPLTAIDDSTTFTRSQMGATDGNSLKVDIVYDESGFTDKQPGAPTVSAQDDDGKVRDITYAINPSGELREKRSNYDPYSQTLIRAHDSTKNAKIPPEYYRGGGEALRASQQIFGRWHMSSLGTQYGDKPNSDWDEFQRWTYVESSAVTRNVPIAALNDEVRLFWSVPVIGYSKASSERTQSTRPGGDELVLSGEEDITIDFEVLDVSGKSVVTDSLTSNVPFYKRNLNGAWVFFTQMEVRRRFTSPDPRWTFREGQLFNIEGGRDERQIVEALYSSVGVTGLTAGDMYRAVFTLNAPSTTDFEYVVVGQPVIQQYVTQTTES